MFKIIVFTPDNQNLRYLRTYIEYAYHKEILEEMKVEFETQYAQMFKIYVKKDVEIIGCYDELLIENVINCVKNNC